MAIGEFLSYEVFSSIPFMRHLTARIRCIFALLEMQTNILQQFKSLSRSRRKDRSVHFVGTFHFYSDPPLWMSTLRRQLVGIRFQRDRQKDQRVPTKKGGGRNLLIHRGGSEINGTSQEERGTLLLNSAYLLVGAMRKSYQNA